MKRVSKIKGEVMKKVIICMLAALVTLQVSAIGKTKTSDFKPTFGLKNKTEQTIDIQMQGIDTSKRIQKIKGSNEESKAILFQNDDAKAGPITSYSDISDIYELKPKESWFIQFPNSLDLATFVLIMIKYKKSNGEVRVQSFTIDPKQTYFLKFSPEKIVDENTGKTILIETVKKQEGRWFKTVPGGYSLSGNKIPKTEDKTEAEAGM